MCVYVGMWVAVDVDVGVFGGGANRAVRASLILPALGSEVLLAACDCHAVAGVLKQLLRELEGIGVAVVVVVVVVATSVIVADPHLPEPLIPWSAYTQLLEASGIVQVSRI